MTKYLCPCGMSHSAEEWDAATREHFENPCTSITVAERDAYYFICPSCDCEFFGDEINVVEVS